MIPMLEANWNRPVIVVAILCITVVACMAIWALVKIKGW